MQKESLAKTLKHDLKDAKEQILTKLYKSVQVYLGMFTGGVVFIMSSFGVSKYYVVVVVATAVAVAVAVAVAIATPYVCCY